MNRSLQVSKDSNHLNPPFTKILIANRGEIACRIIRTARRIGISTVAVYSDPDAGSLHVRQSDESVRIGPASLSESYLNAEAILSAAQSTKAEAIHPGYGFLSENAEFAQQVNDAGLKFIGPPASAINAMGAKNAAKRLMMAAGVPVVPGYHGAQQDDGLLLREAQRVEFPVLIKPSAGGGGKGMRIARNAEEFIPRLTESRREAVASFGNGDVIVERLVQRPRHIEVQVFGDSNGKAVHLFERDCTLQRRYQKIIEECPAPGITEAFRNAICSSAVRAAEAIGYVGAGTVEFIADGSKGLSLDSFWFMEMNTRLQVEHPVTEEALGIDLVEWQLLASAGLPLPLESVPKRPRKCAVEARVYAEDPANGFLPSAGRLVQVEIPTTCRVDTGVEASDEITPHYDPMIAKYIASGSRREQVREKLISALSQSKIRGVATNVALLIELLNCQEFVNCEFDTGTIDVRFEKADPAKPPEVAVVLAAIGIAGHLGGAIAETGFTIWGRLHQEISFRFGQNTIESVVQAYGKDRFEVEVFSKLYRCHRQSGIWLVNGQVVTSVVLAEAGDVHVFHEGIWHFSPVDHLDVGSSTNLGGDCVRAPMPGIVKAILTAVGEHVEEGKPLAIMEAMKMELTLDAPQSGTVKKVCVTANSQVAQDDDIILLNTQDEVV